MSFSRYFDDNTDVGLSVTVHWTADWYPDQSFDDVAYSQDLQVLNVQPTADFHFSIDEINDNQITASLTDPSDPSQADTDAGFKYSFATNPDDLADNYGDAGTSSSATLDYSSGTVIYARVFDKDSGYSDFSSADALLPTINAASISPTGVTLSWLDVTDGQAVRWRVRRSDDGVNYSDTHWTLADPDARDYTDTSVEPGQTYYYIVRGLGAADDPTHVGQTPFSFSIQVAIPDFSAPSGLTADEAGPTTASLNWTDETDYEDGFKILRSDDEGDTWNTIDTVGTDATTYTATISNWSADPLFEVEAYMGDPNSPTLVSDPSEAVPVTPATPTIVTQPTSPGSPLTGTSTNLSILGGGILRGASYLTYTWSETSKPSDDTPDVVFSDNGTNSGKNTTATFFAAGTYTLICTVDNNGASVDSNEINVTVNQTASSIAVDPAYAEIGPDDNPLNAVSANELDQFGDPMATQPTFNWTTSTAPEAGYWQNILEWGTPHVGGIGFQDLTDPADPGTLIWEYSGLPAHSAIRVAVQAPIMNDNGIDWSDNVLDVTANGQVLPTHSVTHGDGPVTVEASIGEPNDVQEAPYTFLVDDSGDLTLTMKVTNANEGGWTFSDYLPVLVNLRAYVPNESGGGGGGSNLSGGSGYSGSHLPLPSVLEPKRITVQAAANGLTGSARILAVANNVEVSLGGAAHAAYFGPVIFSQGVSAAQFSGWISDDLGMLIGNDESINVVNNGTSWTITIPDDAILFHSTQGSWGLGNFSFKPVLIQNASHTAQYTLYPNVLYHADDIQGGGFTFHNALSSNGMPSDWQVSGQYTAKFAWIGDSGFVDGVLKNAMLGEPPAPPPPPDSPPPPPPITTPVDLQVNSNNDSILGDANDDAIEDDAGKPGVIIPVNADDDNNNGVMDYQEGNHSIAGEHDLVKMILQAPQGMTSGSLTLTIVSGTANVRVWYSLTRDNLGPIIGWRTGATSVDLPYEGHDIVLYVEGVHAASTAPGDIRFMLEATPDGEAGPVSRDFVRATVINVKFLKTYSDQTANVNGNYLIGKSGKQYTGLAGSRGEESGYILMATSGWDNLAAVRADVRISPDAPQIRSYLQFALVNDTVLNAAWFPAVTALSGNVLRIRTFTPGQPNNNGATMRFAWGIDYNSDRAIVASEIMGKDAIPFTIVDNQGYSNAVQNLFPLEDLWGGLGMSYASDFMDSFLTDRAATGATTTTVNLTPDAPNLWHNVGAVFDTSLNAPIRRNTFGPNSGIAQKTVDSASFADLITQTALANRSTLLAGLGSPISETARYSFRFDTGDSKGVNFGAHLAADSDLAFAIGHLTINNPRTPANAPLTITGTARYLVLGANVVEILLQNVKVTGTVYDLYDFDYSAAPVYFGTGTFLLKDAAIVQAGYGGFGRSAGHVFDTVVNLATTRMGYDVSIPIS